MLKGNVRNFKYFEKHNYLIKRYITRKVLGLKIHFFTMLRDLVPFVQFKKRGKWSKFRRRWIVTGGGGGSTEIGCPQL